MNRMKRRKIRKIKKGVREEWRKRETGEVSREEGEGEGEGGRGEGEGLGLETF